MSAAPEARLLGRMPVNMAISMKEVNLDGNDILEMFAVLRCILYDKFSQIPEVRWTSMASLNPEMGQLVQTFYPQ